VGNFFYRKTTELGFAHLAVVLKGASPMKYFA